MSDAYSGLTKDEALELQKIRIRQEMQEEISAWAKKRFTLLGLVVAVLGFFGLSTVMHQSLQILLTKPVERELQKLDSAKEEANKKVIELSLLSKSVGEQGHNAQQAAADAAQRIRELEQSIDKSRSDAIEIQSGYEAIRSGMSRVSNEVFELTAGVTENEKYLEAEIKRASETMNALRDLSIVIAESFPDTRVDAALQRFEGEMNNITQAYKHNLVRIQKIRGFNIVFYIDSGEYNVAAHEIVTRLKSEGYRAAVWYAQGADRNDVINEISSEFGDIADVLQNNATGIVTHPANEDVAEEIADVLSSEFQLKDVASVKRPLQPVEAHLTYDQGRKFFDADKIILIYSLDTDGG